MLRKPLLGRILSGEFLVPVLISSFQVILQIAFHGNYGYFRDELYYLACSDHLAFGYVDQPPLSIWILKLNRLLLGDSLQALRFLPALAGGAVVLLAALMARRLGGGRVAQRFAALSVVAAPGLLGHGQYFSMNAFDVLFWAFSCYLLVLILGGGKPKLWLLFGVVAGLGLENKYSIGLMILGLVVGLLLTRERKHVVSGWFWAGAAIAALIFLPHLLWEISNGFPSLEFMHNATESKNVHLSALDFLRGQFRDMNLLSAPLWIAGIYVLYRHEGGRYRALAWMYPAVFILMITHNAKVYYLSPIYPLFFAGGAVLLEGIIREHGWNWVKPVYASFLIAMAIVAVPFALPVLPVEQFINYQKFLGMTPHSQEVTSIGDLPQGYADQFGWEEMVATVAAIYKRLTPEEQAQCVIYVRNYGEAGAIDFFGKKYGLPNALCAHNSYWMWGPGERTGDIGIIFGDRKELADNLADLKGRYRSVELAGVTDSKYCMPYENGRQIFICKGMNTTFQKLWPHERFYI